MLHLVFLHCFFLYLLSFSLNYQLNHIYFLFPLQYLPLCAGLAARSGLDEMEALKAITINPAEIVGISDRVGSLEVGKDADIVIFNGNPIKDIDCKTFATIINGEVVYRK